MTSHLALLQVAADEVRDVSPVDADALEDLSSVAVSPKTAFDTVRLLRKRLGCRLPTAEVLCALRRAYPL